ncbi:hypothetical protein N7478_008257 [Penicillium angulare]|uniref:uncharacterized protein n=1 Tax=Penicillium angulare TaxID=116970 RepID=UPI002541F0F5|nr:uncharacterized protein N7478_008257 [Penicillium angulare]KAJ5273132.1 hypothetical protein N7478_008257 [Penicillium angulare]
MSLSSTKTTTMSTKTQSTSSPTETGGRWSLLIFAKEKCKGDYYYVSGTTTGCVNLQSDMTTTVADDEILYWNYVSTDLSWTSCADGPLTTPGSWGFTDAVCNVFTTSDCTDPDNTSQTFTSIGEGECQAYGDETFPEIKWHSVQCKDIIDAYNE